MGVVANVLGLDLHLLVDEDLQGEVSARALERLRVELLAWEDTPYRRGQQCKGAGVDCVRFVAAVLDELAGTRTAIEALPDDQSFHDRDGAVRAMLRFSHLFGMRPVSVLEAQPGDVLITAPPGGGPGHALIVGAHPTLWEAGYPRVRRCGWALPPSYLLCGAYRVQQRAAWGRVAA